MLISHPSTYQKKKDQGIASLMEPALLCGFLNIILGKLVSMAEENYKLIQEMKSHMEFLERELSAISSVVQRQLSSKSNSLESNQKVSIGGLSKLAYEIEDCLDSLMYRAVQKRNKFGYRSKQKSLLQLAKELKDLTARPAEELERSNRYAPLDATTETSSSTGWTGHEAAYADQPVGIDAAVKELLEQLAEEAEGQPKKLKVISIVGFPGSGKTVLARALYNSTSSKADKEFQFGLRAWVRAPQSRAKEVLMKIAKELGAGGYQTLQGISDDEHLVDIIRQHLENQRYLIVIDDMRTDVWRDIENAFPRDDRFSSRIMVTTTVKSVAKASNIANINVHVHKMGRLDKEKSKELFVRKACLAMHSDYEHPDCKRILEKCDGQALALVTVGQFLRKRDWPTGQSSNNVCRRLRYHLLKDEALERMRQVLIHSYASLPSHAPKACLMYLAMFPIHHPIKRKNLMRLWLADGFLKPKPSCGPLDLAEDNFNTLVEHSIIEPVDVSNNSNVKTCKTYGMMREFILINSISQGFIALRGEEKLEAKPSYVRRLCFYESSATDDRNLDCKFNLIRSLMVHGEASKAILEFHKYQLLRILDLEGCTADLGDDCLKGICNLFLLKYLSLGGTVTSLPK